MNQKKIRISRVLHAGYILESESTRIAFDPIFENPFSRNCFAYPSVKFDIEKIKNLELSAIFISHFHDDHCSLESLALLDRKIPVYIFCLHEELPEMIRQIGFQEVNSLKLNQSVSIGSFEVTTLRALDAEVDSIFHIKSNGLNILNVVDSWIDDETLDRLRQIETWDLVLWPFQTMRELEVLSPTILNAAPIELPAEWINQLKLLNPRYVVASSCQFIHEIWSWYNHALFPITYNQFQSEVGFALPHAKVISINPSNSVLLTSTSLIADEPLAWVIPVGEQNVDYQYRPDAPVPLTQEIAQNFAALSSVEADLVSDFCMTGLIEKYNSLSAPEDKFFDQEKKWSLSLYDHEGKENVHNFIVQKGILKRNKNGLKSCDWHTEVPIAKLYSALMLGEALTSMYIRIKVNQEVDIIEDPLIRCLFTGVFGSYQRAQLTKILAK